MKTLILTAALALPVLAQENILDLTNPANYADQAVPAYITRDNTPADNPITDLGATLGRVLFHDKRLSRNDTISCASCHSQENAFGDLALASTGVAGTTGRHSMRLVNARFSDEERFFWDERAASAEAQATQPIQDHVEMGFSGTAGDPGFSDLVEKLSAIEEYQVLFRAVFGEPTINEDRVGKALAQFVRSLQSFDSWYDAGRAIRNEGQPFPNFTASENNGKQIFLTPPNQGGAGCAGCHQPPEFSISPNSGNNGVSGAIGGGTDFTNTRAPSLRDLVDANGIPHGGFMHDASLPTLLAVIDHYDAIPAVVPGIDPRLTRGGGPGNPPQPQRLNLTAQQKADLASFLETLTGNSIYTDPKYSSPFETDGSLNLVVLPADQTVTILSIDPETGAETMTYRCAGVPNVGYLFQTSTDLDEWSSTTVTASPEGLLEMSVPFDGTEPRMFCRFAYGTVE